MNNKFKINCPSNCEYKDFDYSLYGRIDFCTLEYGIEETLEETKLNSGKFKRTEFCKKTKFLEEK